MGKARRTRLRKRKTRRRTQRGGSAANYEHPGSPIKVFISADRMEPTLNALLTSLKGHNYSYEVVGLGKPWRGFKTKMENYLDGINRYSGEYAVFVDAFDVLCIKDADRLLATYKAKKRSMPIVVGTEIICFYEENCGMDALNWYDENQLNGGRAAIEKTLVKPEPGRPYYQAPESVFLNSGFIMGPAQDLKHMFQSMMDSGDKDDQIAVINYMKGHMNKIDLDVEESFVRNKLRPRTKLPDEDGQQGPAFVHFPGTRTKDEQKRNIEEYYPQYDKNLN